MEGQEEEEPENEKVRFSFQTGHNNHSSRSTASGSLMFFDFLQRKWKPDVTVAESGKSFTRKLPGVKEKSMEELVPINVQPMTDGK